MDSKKSNKIRDIVRLQQILRKWKNLAHHNNKNTSSSSSSSGTTTNSSSSSSSIKLLKKTLSFTDLRIFGGSTDQEEEEVMVPKGYLAVCVGRELKRYIIPTEYLSDPSFSILLREAEDEFGFQQEGVLKLPCPVPVFDNVVQFIIAQQNNKHSSPLSHNDTSSSIDSFFSSDSDLTTPPSHLPPLFV